MTPRVSATFLATLIFVADNYPSTLGFNLASGSAVRQQQRGRVRARPLSSHDSTSRTSSVPTAADKEDDEEFERDMPPPRRHSRADIDMSSMDLALLNLDLPAGEDENKPQRRQASNRGNVDSASTASLPEMHPDLLTAVQEPLARGNVPGAIAVLASTVHGLAQRSGGCRSAGHASDKADDVSCFRRCFTAVLTGCADRGLWRDAKQVLVKHMPAAGVEISAADWLLAIDACAGAGGSEQAVFLLHDMRARGAEIDRSVYGSAVRACARSGGTGRAVFLVKDALKRSIPLLPADIADVMRTVTTQAAGWKQALALYDAFLEILVGQAQERSASETGGGGSSDDADDRAAPLSGQRRPLHLLPEVAPGWEDVCQAALEACTRAGDWERALEVLNILRAGGGGAELSGEAYDEAIEVCGKGCAWDMVLLLVAEMRSDEMPISPAAFETALEGCASTGSWAWARSLLSSGSTGGAHGIRLDVNHYLKALRACAAVVDKPGGTEAQKAARSALEMLQDIREAGWLTGKKGEDAYVCAMQACVAAEDAWSALALLDSAQDDRVWRSMKLRTAAMQACSGAGEWRAALSLLDDVQAEGLRPGGAAYVAAMAACARGGVVERALELLDRVLVEHPGDETTISAGYHGAIAACAECGHWEGATSLLQRMRQDGLAVVTTEVYNTAILACSRAQQSVAALSLLGDMSVEGGELHESGGTTGEGRVRPDEASYIHVMRAFGREGRWQTVMDLLRSMREEGGLAPSVKSYNVVMEALSKTGEWKRTLGMLEQMKREGIRPTEFTYTRCMTACDKSGQWEQTIALMSEMKEQEDLVPDSYVCSTAMMACSRAGRVDDVLGIMQEMRSMPGGRGPNLVNYNIAIGSCARAREWPRMLEEMDKMRWEDINPQESTFVVPLDVCARSGELSMALTLLARMRKYHVEPGVVSYGSAVAAACGAGDAASAALLLDEMEAVGHPPNEVTYGVAALACRDGANADAAVDLLRRRKDQGLPPDALLFSFAVQACSKAGDLERGLGLIADMKGVGLTPDSEFYTGVIAGISACFCPFPDGSRRSA